MQHLILAAFATVVLSANLTPSGNAAAYHAPAHNYEQNNWMRS